MLVHLTCSKRLADISMPSRTTRCVRVRNVPLLLRHTTGCSSGTSSGRGISSTCASTCEHSDMTHPWGRNPRTENTAQQPAQCHMTGSEPRRMHRRACCISTSDGGSSSSLLLSEAAPARFAGRSSRGLGGGRSGLAALELSFFPCTEEARTCQWTSSTSDCALQRASCSSDARQIPVTQCLPSSRRSARLRPGAAAPAAPCPGSRSLRCCCSPCQCRGRHAATPAARHMSEASATETCTRMVPDSCQQFRQYVLPGLAAHAHSLRGSRAGVPPAAAGMAARSTAHCCVPAHLPRPPPLPPRPSQAVRLHK